MRLSSGQDEGSLERVQSCVASKIWIAVPFKHEPEHSVWVPAFKKELNFEGPWFSVGLRVLMPEPFRLRPL